MDTSPLIYLIIYLLYYLILRKFKFEFFNLILNKKGSMGKCSHCGTFGHNYVKCPQLTREQVLEIKKKKKEEKEKKLEAKKKKLEEKEKMKMSDFTIHNNNDYEIAVYWGFNTSDLLTRLQYIPAFESKVSRIRKSCHRIVAFPSLEVISGNSNDAESSLTYAQNTDQYIVAFDFYMKDFPDSSVELHLPYQPKKTEIDEWKEYGLKSHYLLKEIEKLTSIKKDGNVIVHKKYENIETFIDMIQDISMPNNCSDVDKERARIPSILTNIT